MNNSVSRVERINFLTKNKRYVAPIAFQLKSSARKMLSAGAYKTWDFLRDLSAFDIKNYSIKISQEYLASELDCSLKTISRHISEIKKAGFLTIKHNIKQDKTNEPSTYYINFPESVFVLAELENNRTSIVNEDSSIISEKDAAIKTNILHTNIKENKCYTITQEPLSFSIKNSNILIRNSAPSSTLLDSCTPKDKNVQCLTVKNDSLINNIKINNNNIVVDLSLYEQENNKNFQQKISDLELRLDNCKNDKTAIQLQLKKFKSIYSLDDHLKSLKDAIKNPNKKTLVINSEIQNLNNQLQKNSEVEEYLKVQLKLLESKLQSYKKFEEVKQNPNFINHVNGDRQFTTKELNSMLDKLKSYGLSGKQLNSIANEIVFESRFGSLTKCPSKKEFNSIKKCINIGCKLVREGQWSTPNGLFHLKTNFN